MLEDYQNRISALKTQILDTWRRLDPDGLRLQIEDQDKLTHDPEFWNDQVRAQKVMSGLKRLRGKLEPWEQLVTEVNDLQEFYQLAVEERDESVEPEILELLQPIEKRYDELRVLELLSDEADRMDCFLEIHAGAGGTEACDWASMLTRMYTRWAERRKYKVEIVDLLEAEGGIKSATLQISGEFAYGYLKNENGVHRLVRISPFDAAARRHTSFVSVAAHPVLDETIDVDIKDDDIRIDTFRAQGAGGQHVNKTDSAIRITHFPTGIVVQCQNERSQHKNKATALSMLRSKLYEYYKAERDKENEKYSADKKAIEWGSQIRSYVFQPYTLVKDHRNKYESGNVQAVMDGEIDDFIEEFMKFSWENKAFVPDDADDL
ncbi:MAG: peptide chain release factor 2 [Spirochaetales bacterium]|nr:peptide chain release factor 2 [Spirochaetales bacterium]